MVKPVINFMENYAPTPNRIYDLYQYYMGGGSNQPGTGGQTAPVGMNQFIPQGGGGGNMMMGGLGSPQMIGNFNQAIAQRQNRLNNPGTIAQFAYGMGLPKQDSVQQMMARGMLGKKDSRSLSGMPLGISGLLAKAIPDQYGNMTLGDQILTQSYMGFTDPNTGMANKDPFGINVRSAMGNYSEYANKQVGKLGDMLSGRLADKYGATWDEELGAYTGKNAKKANDMTKMLREKYGFYGKVKNKKQDIASDLGLIQKAIEADKKAKHDAAVKNLKTSSKGITSVTTGGSAGGAGMTARERGAAASRMGGGSRQAKSGGQKAGGSGRTDGGWGWAKGGIVELLK
jgi:hypothetical protein